MNKWFFLFTILVAGLLVAAAPTVPPAPIMNSGAMCDMGPNNAATLLVPYFEVDSIESTGLNTLVAVTNVTADPAIAHVTLWNVDSVHTIDFNIYLTGYDIATFSVRDIFNGNLPNNGCATATSSIMDGWIDCNRDGLYFNQTTANMGGFGPLYQQTFQLNCGGACDFACYGPLDPGLLTYLRYMHTQCSYDWPTLNYVGYITIDYAYTCQGGFPDESSPYWYPYIDLQQTAAANATFEQDVSAPGFSNAFIGDYFYIDFANNYAQGESCVHIEAFGFGADQNPSGFLAGQYSGMTNADWLAIPLATYYGRVLPFSGFLPNPAGQDQREPLPLSWGFRYLENAAFNGGADALIWRGHNWFEGPWTFGDTQYPECHSLMYDYWGTYEYKLPDPFVSFWDEEENGVTAGGGPSQPPTQIGVEIPVETARYNIVQVLNSPFEAGWVAMSFATDARANLLPNIPNAQFGAFDQSWVTVVYQALGAYSVGFSGSSWENNCTHAYITGGGGASVVIPNDV